MLLRVSKTINNIFLKCKVSGSIMCNRNRMVIIDDLEPIEAEIVAQFLRDAVANGDIDLSIQDCITIRDEVKFHAFDPTMKNGKTSGTLRCFVQINGEPCTRYKYDTIHTKAYEVE